MSQLEADLRTRLRALDLPDVPQTLDAKAAAVVATPHQGRRPGLLAVALVAAIAVMLAVLISARPLGTALVGGYAFPVTVDGLHAYTVDELLAARSAGQVRNGPYAVGGYWSTRNMVHSCAAPLPGSAPGELELYCHDHEYGIVARNETVKAAGDAAFANGMALTPYVPTNGAGPVRQMFDPVSSATPVPIVVVGHFDDPRAADCRPDARQLCEDRFVIDSVKLFASDVTASALPSSAPTGSEPPVEQSPAVPPSATEPPASPTPSLSDASGYPFPSEVDGLHVASVSELLNARAAKQASGGPYALKGFWSGSTTAHSCPAPQGNPGTLEVYCHDGEWGIAQFDQPFVVVKHVGNMVYTEPGTSGPKLTPYVPDALYAQLALQPANGQPYPPVPIVAVGHFDDPRAADCRPEARQLCLDRFVVDRIALFAVDTVPSPGMTPEPMPYQPAPSESPLFDASQCFAGPDGKAAVFSYVGWMDGGGLRLTSGLDLSRTTVWVAISKDAVPLGEWFRQQGDTRESLAMGRLVCYAFGGAPSEQGVALDSLAGSYYRVYRDGSTMRPSSAP